MEGENEELLKKAQARIVRARVQLLLKQPFFGVLASYLEPRPAQLAPHSGGMGTDGKYLYYQPDKLERITDSQLEGVVAHEVMHVALGHLWRREHRRPFRWNIATDYAVNAIVKKNFELPKWALYRAEWEGKCAEEIYSLLPTPTCPKCGSTNIRGRITKVWGCEVEVEYRCKDCGHKWRKRGEPAPGDIPCDTPDELERTETEEPEWNQPLTPLDDHGVWEKTEANGQDPKTRAEKLEQEWRARVVRAAQAAKSQGQLPEGLERFIEDLLYPKLSWRSLLWQYVARARGMRPNWRRPNRKYLQYGVYYPSKQERRLDAAVAIDTSGSISDEELREFLSELRGILATFRSFRVRMLACDAAVHADVTATSLEDFDSFRAKVKGRGGTDFRPVFDALKNDVIRVLIYLTDGYGDYPREAPGYSVIWVISKEGDPKRPPFGQVISLGE